MAIRVGARGNQHRLVQRARAAKKLPNTRRNFGLKMWAIRTLSEITNDARMIRAYKQDKRRKGRK